MTERSNFKYS